MRAILLVFVVFAAGIFIGHEFWPQSHPDAAFHFRFHRGRLPQLVVPEVSPSPTPVVPMHGRVMHSPKPATQP